MRKVSSSIFGLAVLLFLLPWMTVSCGGEKIFTFSGTDLAIGKTVKVPQGFGTAKKENARDWRITIAFLAGIAGTLADFLIKVERVQKIVLAVCGSAGCILLYLFKAAGDREIVAQGAGMITVDYHFGFWVSMLLFFGAGIFNILALAGVLEKVTIRGVSGVTYKNSLKPSFCTQCGAKVSPDDTFCSECGHSLK
ncbi:MAG: zinc ribbon domain-containing protein [bacterium]